MQSNKFRIEIWRDDKKEISKETEVIQRKGNNIQYMVDNDLINRNLYNVGNSILFFVNGSFYEFIDSTLESFMESKN